MATRQQATETAACMPQWAPHNANKARQAQGAQGCQHHTGHHHGGNPSYPREPGGNSPTQPLAHGPFSPSRYTAGGTLAKSCGTEPSRWHRIPGATAVPCPGEATLFPGALELWDWGVVQRRSQRSGALRMCLHGNPTRGIRPPAGGSSHTGPSWAPSGGVKTSPIVATSGRHVLVSSGKVYKLCAPHADYLRAVERAGVWWDDEDPTRDWGLNRGKGAGAARTMGKRPVRGAGPGGASAAALEQGHLPLACRLEQGQSPLARPLELAAPHSNTSSGSNRSAARRSELGQRVEALKRRMQAFRSLGEGTQRVAAPGCVPCLPDDARGWTLGVGPLPSVQGLEGDAATNEGGMGSSIGDVGVREGTGREVGGTSAEAMACDGGPASLGTNGDNDEVFESMPLDADGDSDLVALVDASHAPEVPVYRDRAAERRALYPSDASTRVGPSSENAMEAWDASSRHAAGELPAGAQVSAYASRLGGDRRAALLLREASRKSGALVEDRCRVPGVPGRDVCASTGQCLSSDNVGFKMLAAMGWTPGTGIGARRQGRTDPLMAHVSLSAEKVGLGWPS
eukprot:jgi/Mesvir1/21189/Mv08650-RA.1